MGVLKHLRKKGQVIYVVSVLGGIRRCHADHLNARFDFVEEELEEISNVGERTAATSPAKVITPPASPQQMTQQSPQTR